MDIHRLMVFCRVIELQSFTKAAEAVCLTQPTVSEHIRALEESVGEKLIDRLGREVLPTPAGKILYQYAREILQLRDKALQALEKHKGSLSGSLYAGASTIPGTYILPVLIGSFKKMYPLIQITLSISSSGDVVQKILDGSVEFGVIGARWEDRRIILEKIYSDELVLAVYPEHPWAGRESVNLSELPAAPFIQRERASGTRKVLGEALEANGVPAAQLNVVAEMGSTEAVRQGIKAGIGISILSAHAVREDVKFNTLSAVPLDGVRIVRPFYLARRKNRELSSLCSTFLEFLRAQPEKPAANGD
jgi:DNA-binding transcriptional LysR family regulator